MSMYIQELAYMVEDQNTPIRIVTKNKEEILEANAYLLRRVLYIAEHISADNIELTVSEQTFDDLKKYLNQ